MRVTLAILFLGVVVLLTGCSNEGKVRREAIISQAVDQFHQRLNESKYEEIYQLADDELKTGISQSLFGDRLRDAQTRIGTVANQASVWVPDGYVLQIRRTLFDRELVEHGEYVGNHSSVEKEHFMWAVSGTRATLVSYKLEFMCEKPCDLEILTK
jgi:hypothetical protein